jgi:hypothetical protein
MSSNLSRAPDLRGTSAKSQADNFARFVEPRLKEAIAEGVRSNACIADYLTMRGIRTATGNRTWDERQVSNLRVRLKGLGAD